MHSINKLYDSMRQEMNRAKRGFYSLLCISLGLVLGHVISPFIGRVWASSVVPAAYNLVQNGGVNLTRRTTINCTGSLTCSDSGSLTTFNVAAGGAIAPSITDTYANIAATTCNGTNEGQIGLPNNNPFQGMCHSSAWIWWFFPVGPITPPGLCGDYNNNYNTAANWVCTNSVGTIFVDQTIEGSVNFRGVYKSTPVTPWTKTGCLETDYAQNNGANAQLFGIFITDATKAFVVGTAVQSSGFPQAQAVKWTNSTTNAGTAGSLTSLQQGSLTGSKYQCYRISDDGSTLTFSWSPNNITYTTVFSESVGTFITPTGYGFGGFERGTGTHSYSVIVSLN